MNLCIEFKETGIKSDGIGYDFAKLKMLLCLKREAHAPIVIVEVYDE
jgi:hypothetical protein